jgi:hypothetical protein
MTSHVAKNTILVAALVTTAAIAASSALAVGKQADSVQTITPTPLMTHPVAAGARSGGDNGRITIVTTEFVPAKSLTGDAILIARGGPFGSVTPGHGTEYITKVQPTSVPNVFVYVGHDVYTTSFGTIGLKWRASCHPVNSTLTKYFCANGTWHLTSGQGAYHAYHGAGTFTNISYSDSSGASFAHSYEQGQLELN